MIYLTGYKQFIFLSLKSPTTIYFTVLGWTFDKVLTTIIFNNLSDKFLWI